MSIRVVTHCYAKELPQYAEFLRYQLASLTLHPTVTNVVASVCYDPSDTATSAILDWFEDNWTGRRIKLDRVPMLSNTLGRRAIGRNIVALKQQEDYVWFTDVDHLFYSGSQNKNCLDMVKQQFESNPDASMIYPHTIRIHREHALGDALVRVVRDKYFLPILPSDREFVDKTYNRAIGGVQIVRGAFARELGYLNGSKWVKPLKPNEKPFGDFKDDVAYRKECEKHGPIKAVCLPGVYRLRHSQTSYQE